jgi:predicted ester cyclase
MKDPHTHHKALIAPLRAAMYDFEAEGVRNALKVLLHPDAIVHLPYPFGDLNGPDAYYETCFAPLHQSMPDLERRDWIVIGGRTEHDGDWVGCAGHYVGTFASPWLDIPPTGHLAHMRFHEFFRFEDDKIVEVQALWDIPELMLQAGAWPMAPSLGLEICIPGPAGQDGLVQAPHDQTKSQASCQHVIDMLECLQKHPSQGGPEVMEMLRFWHARMNWYGPAGIGTCRGISGFRNWHQIPFLNGMPDRGQHSNELTFHFFGDANYVGVTGWPNMIQTVSHDGWMGIPPSDKRIDLKSLDFWRIESGKIRENWVLVDLLDTYKQLGVDVLGRMREFNKSRVLGSIPFPVGEP